jgi:hypothetical protein
MLRYGSGTAPHPGEGTRPPRSRDGGRVPATARRESRRGRPADWDSAARPQDVCTPGCVPPLPPTCAGPGTCGVASGVCARMRAAPPGRGSPAGLAASVVVRPSAARRATSCRKAPYARSLCRYGLPPWASRGPLAAVGLRHVPSLPPARTRGGGATAPDRARSAPVHAMASGRGTYGTPVGAHGGSHEDAAFPEAVERAPGAGPRRVDRRGGGGIRRRHWPARVPSRPQRIGAWTAKPSVPRSGRSAVSSPASPARPAPPVRRAARRTARAPGLRLRTDQVGAGVRRIHRPRDGGRRHGGAGRGDRPRPGLHRTCMAGLIPAARDGEVRPGQRPVFLHTGGMPGLFGRPAALAQAQAVVADPGPRYRSQRRRTPTCLPGPTRAFTARPR